MVISYGNISSIKDMDIYLCSPTEERLACILATDRVFTACYNDLSLFEMSVYSTKTSEDYYDLIETMRLIEVTGIGYFQITSAQEDEGENGKYKRISAESLQTVFKRFGIDIQNRVYCLYNSTSPLDSLSNHPNDDSFIPSIVGELHQQIGVEVEVQVNDTTPTEKCTEWTITYISDSLKYSPGGTGICRTMDENVEFAYDLLVNKVEEAFGCVVIFDYMYKTIKFYSIDNVAQLKNAYLSFDNFTTDIQVEENADDIVTVLRCEGDGIDISLVNPIGAGYITDFSYYKDTVNHKWMSAALIAKLNQWEAAIEAAKPGYETNVTTYRNAYYNIGVYQAELTTTTKVIQDLQATLDEYAKASADGQGSSLVGSTAICESVKVGEKSIASTSSYYNTAFTATSMVMAYTTAPTWNSSTGQFEFATGTPSYFGTATVAYNSGYYYFFDGDRTRSYCKIKATLNSQTPLYDVSGFDRFVSYKFLGAYISMQEKKAAKIKSDMDGQTVIAAVAKTAMTQTAWSLNVANYFSGDEDLYAELKRYWIEGTYNDSSIAMHDTMTIAEQIDLANELLANGRTELAKVCQPRFRLSMSGVNCFANAELRDIADTLNLGDVLTVERDASTRYYPVLLKIVFNFDDPTQLQIELANSLRLDDWGYTWADLVTNSAQTSRNVSSNWQELISYANERQNLINLVENPLNSALRAANRNMTNQNFSVDTSGILGRVITVTGDNTVIDDEQIRILNNMILFTRDNWQSAAAAFGKITFDDPVTPGSQITAYGLVADAIIGKLLIGSQLVIANSDNKILLNGSGITIKNNSDVEVFSASTNGNVYVKGEINATSGSLQNLTINGTLQFGDSSYYLTTNDVGQSLITNMVNLPGFVVTAYKLGDTTTYSSSFSGMLSAPSGNIGGWQINTAQNRLYKTVNNYTTAMQASGTSGDDAFYVKYNGSGTLNTLFAVNNNGQMTANNAVVKGVITANSLAVKDTLIGSNGSLTVYGSTYFDNDIEVRSKANIAEIHGTSTIGESSGSASITVTSTCSTFDDPGGTVNLTFSYSSVSHWADTTGSSFDLYIISKYNTRYISDKITIFVSAASSSRITSGTYQFSGILYQGLSTTPVTDPSQPPTGMSDTISTTLTKSYAGSGASNAIVISGNNHIVPAANSAAPGFSSNLGLSAYRWDTLYCLSVNQSSSRDIKDKIATIPDEYDIFFDNLQPRSFLLKCNNNNKTHYGFVVDEVVEAARSAGLDVNECGLLSVDDINDPYRNGSLFYSEFIALNTWEIQKLKARIAELEKLIT